MQSNQPAKSRDRLTATIRCTREHHMSVNSLEKIYSELFGTADSPTNRPVTMESIVRAMLDRLSSSSKETSKKPSDERTNTADTVTTNTHDDNVQPAQTTEVDMTCAEISTQTHTETSVGDMTSTESCMHTATLELETHKKKKKEDHVEHIEKGRLCRAGLQGLYHRFR